MMRAWFATPTFEDEYLTFSFRVLHYTLLLLIGVAVIFLPFTSSPVQLVYIPAVVLLLGLCYVLLHTNHFRLAGGLFLGGLWS